jgi:hypothetical protein
MVRQSESSAHRCINYDMEFFRGLWWEEMSGIGKYGDSFKPVPLRRRDNFPSWSWAGWDEAFRTPSMGLRMRVRDEECNRIEENDFQAKFWVVLKLGLLISLAEYCKSPITQTNGTMDISQVLQV